MQNEGFLSYEELFEKYQVLVTENSNLKEEIEILKARLGTVESCIPADEITVIKTDRDLNGKQPANGVSCSAISIRSGPADKIKLFMSLFKGRDDVYAKRWESKIKNDAGYSPVCLNEWKHGLCHKPKGTCAACTHKAYAALVEEVIYDHLDGKMVAGIYPMLLDETCLFLAIDFDEGEWQKDISALRDVCADFAIPLAVERSRSGNGGHAWFFFEKPITAILARRFGTSLLTHTMSKRHEIVFKSYDRFFPSQDTMPHGGLGNLIALPLQKAARKAKNSEFIDGNFEPYADQWAYLGAIKKLSEDELTMLISSLCQGSELGVLKIDEEEAPKPWETVKVTLTKADFPCEIEVVKANMLFIPKAGITQRALNRLKRLAAFKNPEFYKAQAMRMPTYDKPRIICCADDLSEYLCLPRGCEQELRAVLAEQGIKVNCLDKTK